jgi:hypothetical protein
MVAADIPNLPSSIITSGIFSTARLGSGTASSSTYLRGDGTWTAFPSIPAGTVTSVGVTGTDFTITGTPVTSSGNIAMTIKKGDLVAGDNITFSGSGANKLLGTANLTINADIGTDTTAYKTLIAGDIVSGVVTIGLGATPRAGRHVFAYVNGVKAPVTAVSIVTNTAQISNADMPYNIAVGDYVEVAYTK